MRIAIYTLVSFVKLSRPLNVIVTGFVVVVGGVLAARQAGVDLGDAIYIAGLSAALVAAAGNVINDVYDIKIDRINRQDRPLPSGRVSVVSAVVFSVVLFFDGILLGFSVSRKLGMIAITVALLLWGYSYKLKKLPVIGNVVVALCGGLAFIYGAEAVAGFKHGIFPALFAFLVQLSREIIKDVEDMPGDKAANARTLPLLIGGKHSLHVAAIPLFVLVVLTIVPHHLGMYGLNYLRLVIVTVDFPLLVLIYILTAKGEAMRLRLASQSLKVLMVMGLGVLFFG